MSARARTLAAFLVALLASRGAAQEPAPGGEPPAPAPAGQDPKPDPPAEAPPAVVEQPAPAPPAPSHPAVVWPLAYDGIAQHLHALVEAHPDVAELDVLGRSAGGREILVLRLGAREGALPRPVLFLADYQGRSSAGPEASLAVAWRLAEGFGKDERVRALLTHAELLIAPALDPDARVAADPAAPAPRPAVRFDANFPSGWQPETVRPGSGRVSLSQPETLAVASYLANLKGCAVLLGFAAPAPRGEPYPGSELPPADREVFAKVGAALELPGAGALVPWYELGSSGGGLFDFAYQARGVYALALPLPLEEELASAGLEPFAGVLETRLLRCLALLPRVEIKEEGLERLANDTWQLDVRIQNVGVVPTASALARHRAALADVALGLEGAKLVATAKKPASDAPYTDASFHVRTPLSGGTLAGGEGRWLRLILEAAPGAEVIVTAGSPWAGSDVLRVTLK